MSPLTTVMAARLRGTLAIVVAGAVAAVSLAAAGGAPELTAGEKVIAAARAHVGDTYTWGATGPRTWDCSGFTLGMWRDAAGVTLPRVSGQQLAWAVPLPAEQVEPGDLVFIGDPVTHVGLVESRTTTATRTVVQMIDASSSQKGVVRRAVWSGDVVRFGRVKRDGMTPVRPWKPTATTAPARATAPVAPVVPVATGRPVAPAAKPAENPAQKPAKAEGGVLTGLPVTSDPSSAAALRAVRLARAALGNRTLGDVAFVQNVFRRGANLTLPSSRSGLLAAARRVPLAQARVGDLVVYAAPAAHVGIYVGGGLMVDASRSLGAVVLRPVWAATGLTVRRLPV